MANDIEKSLEELKILSKPFANPNVSHKQSFSKLEFPHVVFSLGINLAGFGLRNCHFFL